MSDLANPKTPVTREAKNVIGLLTGMRKAINAAWDSWDVERQVAAAKEDQDRYMHEAKQKEREQKSSSAKEKKPVGREGEGHGENRGGVEFPHAGKHQPQKVWLGQNVTTTPELFPDRVLEDHTSDKGDAAVYKTANPVTVIAWEQEARKEGLLLSDGFTIVYGFKENIGADHGEMTRFVRIDGDHGHPIIESHQSLNTSFRAYMMKEIESAKGNEDRQRVLWEFLRKLGFSPSTWGLKEPKRPTSAPSSSSSYSPSSSSPSSIKK